MEQIINVISVYYIDVIVLFVFAGISLYLYKTSNHELLKKMILSLVVEAEKQLGSKTGELKYALVVEKLYGVMPPILRLLYSKKKIDSMIEDAVDYLKRYLSDGKNLMGYDSENI
ncbi:hypothetical protein BHU72_05460 [Desulfuribacillus stibiiarsenatis]|uniref:Uncharacterized protein n=1 Tax=Desulfuribacillus stibiiarsenatis TaxID=1390249 RepID=A0A1E5L4S0_9FIRM|nr:hypothetical protein [Desulfuribacillus stibiiarsenatis]OEH85058.1 hypothetical protein BHU72_05460 [Desulfuribacillus stibiiarsenatis]